MSFTQNIPFTTPSNYTYDTDKIEITGGVAKLKDLVTPFVSAYNGVMAVNFENPNIAANADWTTIGTGVGTLNNGATITDNKLVVQGANQNLSISTYSTSHDSQKGCMRCIFIPDYTDNPATEQYIMQLKDGGVENNIQVRQNTGKFIRIWIYDGSGSKIVDSPNIGTYSFTSGQSYELELNWDCDLGEHRFFINGTQLGSTMTGTGTRDNRIDQFDFGVDYNGNGTPNFSIDKFVYFNSVQHTSNYTPTDWSEIPIATYDYNNPTVLVNTTWYIEALEGFTETSTITGSDAIKYLLYKGTTDYYYSGGWIESDGTYSQSTSAADIETNKATYTTSRILFKVKLFLHSNDGSTTPEIDLLSIDYNYGGETPDTISTCIVNGYSIKPDGTPNTDAITFELSRDAVEYKTNTIIEKTTITATPEATAGYYEAELVENENMTQSTQYKVTINGKVGYISVPNEATKELNDLLEF